MKRTVLGVTLWRLVGLMVFLIGLGILNLFYVPFGIVEFLNENVWLIIVMTVYFYLGELFFLFDFPFNFPAPILNAVGSVYLVGFIFGMVFLVDIMPPEAFFALGTLEPVVVVIVFVLVIIVGYVKVFAKPKKVKKKKPKNNVEWQDVGDELKMAAYNLASSIKDALEPKKK